MRQRIDQLLVVQKSFEVDMQRREAEFEQKVKEFNEERHRSEQF